MSEARPGGAVRSRVEQLCDAVEPLLGEGERIVVQQARSSLGEPLRLAVVGRVSTGKSTLVNALVGRRVAPTSAGECTKVVTWYRYGAPDQAHLRLRDGSTRPLRLIDGGLPDDLGVIVADVERLEVRLASGPLRELTLIDTPGLDTLTAANDAATRRAVLGSAESSQRAAGEADALLYLIGDAARRGDVEFLADFHGASGSLSATSLNAVGVLAQADTLGGGPFDPADPFDIARRMASQLAGAHAADLWGVIAVSGLLAETARTGRISEGLAARLADLAAEDPATLSLRRQDSALTDLFRLFGPYGVTAGRDQAVGGAAQLKDWCDAASGVRDLETVIRTRLVPRADLLKATRAIGVISAIAGTPGCNRRDDALDLVEAALLDPVLHPLEELRALHTLAAAAPDSALAAQLAGFVDLPDPRGLLGLAPGVSPGELVAAARQRSALATRAAALAVSPAEVDAGRVLARSYQLLARRINDGG